MMTIPLVKTLTDEQLQELIEEGKRELDLREQYAYPLTNPEYPLDPYVKDWRFQKQITKATNVFIYGASYGQGQPKLLSAADVRAIIATKYPNVKLPGQDPVHEMIKMWWRWGHLWMYDGDVATPKYGNPQLIIKYPRITNGHFRVYYNKE